MTLTHHHRVGIVIAVAFLCIIALALTPPIAQPQEYHDFADQRAILGIPNGLNVLSNLAFLLVGVWGLWVVAGLQGAFIVPKERLPYLLLFLGVSLTCFGSAYYHLAPNDDRLVWDRLPMTVGFTALFSAIIGERISLRLSTFLLPLWMTLGALSVFYWNFTERNLGQGDLRPYIFVQFFTIIGIPLVVALFRPRYSRSLTIFFVVGIYILAKIMELLDRQVLSVSGGVVSGHTLKHLAAAVAVWFVLRMLQQRQSMVSE